MTKSIRATISDPEVEEALNELKREESLSDRQIVNEALIRFLLQEDYLDGVRLPTS